MYRLVQISDTHFGTEKQPVVHALRSKINSLKPDLLICSGDLTQRARHGQFKAASDYLGTLQSEAILCVPGNHDMPLYNVLLRLVSPFSNYQKFIESVSKQGFSPHQFFIKPGLFVMGVNSCNPFHYKNGKIRDSELERIEQALKSAPDHSVKILVAHHPFDAIRASDEENIIPNAESLLSSFGDVGVDVVLGGHIHYQFCRTTEERYPTLKRPIAVCQAGTTLSSRVRAGLPNSFMELQVSGEKSSLKVVQWDYIEGEDDFVATTDYHPFEQKQLHASVMES